MLSEHHIDMQGTFWLFCYLKVFSIIAAFWSVKKTYRHNS